MALLTDLPDKGLTKGEIGTVVEHLRAGHEETVLVEFSDADGQTYAMVDLKAEQLLVLHRRQTEAA